MSEVQTSYYEFWVETVKRAKETLPSQEYSTWFSRISYISSKKGVVTLAGGSQFILDTVIDRFRDMIANTLSELTGEEISVEFIISDKGQSQEAQVKDNGQEEQRTVKKQNDLSKKIARRKEEANLNPSYDFESFVLGDNSAFAYNASLAIAKNPGSSYNPCLIYGDVGLGKTHLLSSIGNYILTQNPELKVVYVTAEMFTNEFIESLTTKSPQQFKNKYRKVDVLLIDDIHFLQNKSSTQEELFHTFNNLYEAKKQMVFTCDRPINQLKDITDRLSSRFERGLNVDLQPPNYETRVAILKKKLQEHGSSLSEEIVNYIAFNIVTNVRDLESSLTKLVAYMDLIGEELTFEKAKQLLGVLPAMGNIARDTLTIGEIIKSVGEYFNVTPFEIKGKKKNKSLVQPRQIAMYLARQITDYSTTEIGTEFGGRDHTTVMYANNRVDSLMKSDEAYAATVNKLKRELTSS